MPLSQGVLKVNLGIPIIVLCNKIDIIHQTGEKAKILQENLDFIQMHLREYSLLYGASVMFTSAKARESKNLDTLYQYINHRLYDKIKFAKKAQIVEKDELFIPTGFDSLNLIKQLQSGSVMMTGPDGQPLGAQGELYGVLKGGLKKHHVSKFDMQFSCEPLVPGGCPSQDLEY